MGTLAKDRSIYWIKGYYTVYYYTEGWYLVNHWDNSEACFKSEEKVGNRLSLYSLAKQTKKKMYVDGIIISLWLTTEITCWASTNRRTP